MIKNILKITLTIGLIFSIGCQITDADALRPLAIANRRTHPAHEYPAPVFYNDHPWIQALEEMVRTTHITSLLRRPEQFQFISEFVVPSILKYSGDVPQGDTLVVRKSL